MNRRQKWLEILKMFLLVAIALSVVLALIFLFGERDDKAASEEYESKISELVYKKQQLLKARDSLDSDMEKELGNTSYMSLIFTQLDSALYTDVYPAMSEGDIKLVGVMAFSTEELPGLEGNITLAQYNELILLGWGNALYWDGEGELEDFITEMEGKLTALDIQLPKTMMFKKDFYDASYDSLLSERGINNAVHGGELKIVESSKPDGVWHPGYIGWRWIGKSTLLKKTVEDEGGYALFEIAFDNAKENTHTSYFPIEGEVNDSNRPSVFVNMMNIFKRSISAGEIEVLNIDDTREKVEKYHADREAREAENELVREEINAQILDVERAMADLYDEYH